MALMLAILSGFGQTNGEARKGDSNKNREEDGGCAWDESKDQIMTYEIDDVRMGDGDLLTVMTMSPKKMNIAMNMDVANGEHKGIGEHLWGANT